MAVKPYIPTARDLPYSRTLKILDSLLNLLYPEVCLLCSEPVYRHRDCGICDNCWNRVVALKIIAARCVSCGLPFHSFSSDSEHLCGNCIQQMPPYDGARSFGYYADELGGLIQGLKFRNRRNLTGFLVSLLADAFFETWSREDFDLIVPVPLHKKRKRQRGYNQSELLAQSLALRLAIPQKRVLSRLRATPPQVGLSDSQRIENVRNAFHVDGRHPLAGKRVLLIDDVMTTGATAASAAKALLDGGAARVSVLTVARAEKH